MHSPSSFLSISSRDTTTPRRYTSSRKRIPPTSVVLLLPSRTKEVFGSVPGNTIARLQGIHPLIDAPNSLFEGHQFRALKAVPGGVLS